MTNPQPPQIKGSLYISTFGDDDSGLGTEASPFPTFGRAQTAVNIAPNSGNPEDLFQVIYLPGMYDLTSEEARITVTESYLEITSAYGLDPAAELTLLRTSELTSIITFSQNSQDVAPSNVWVRHLNMQH